MSEEPGRRRSPRGGRTLRKVALALVVAAGAVASPLAAVALAEPEGSPGHGLWDWAEDRVRANDELHRTIHLALGRIFSICPCTVRLSQSQYRKAGYHGASKPQSTR